MSSLAFLTQSRIALACRPAYALRSAFRPLSSTPHSQVPSTSTTPKVVNKAAVDHNSETLWAEKAGDAIYNITLQPPLNPYSGRAVAVTKSLGDSLKALDGILARNKVKYELRLTERHEKKGVKRRRLASERWRNNFAKEVRRNVQLVMKMRDRGA